MEPAVAVYVLLALVALRFIIVGIGAALLIGPVRSCPACFAETTFRSHHPWLRVIVPWLEWRFCPQCGWQGPARRPIDRDAPADRDALPVVTRDAGRHRH
ncbi:MAG: hypothetical protein L0271_00455 [Gemmatimonadetes bacterium]|nr:hypothetical protein [Gemmatimonadota bacterium]